MCDWLCFQADRDILAFALQEQLDSYPAMEACKYSGRVFLHMGERQADFTVEIPGKEKERMTNASPACGL